MQVQFACQPAHTLAYCFLQYGESLDVEHGAMAMMSDGISVSMGLGGSVGAAIRRKAFGGENALTARYTATTHGAWVAVSPTLPGDLAAIDVSTPVLCDRGSVVAWDNAVSVDVTYSGARAIILREGVVLMHLSGEGTAIIGAYGGLQSFTLTPGQEMVVDTGHLVGWDETVKMRVGMLGSVTTASLSGEGLVARLTGPGRVWCQTRSVQAMREWVADGKPVRP
jgi:uncharacterized protein (TIGR00266 family)